MATMHYLLLGVLSLTILSLGGIGDCTLRDKVAVSQLETRSDIPCVTRQTLQPTRTPLLAPGRSAGLRERIVHIAVREMGVSEATGHNDGARVEEYLACTGLGKGYAWCAAFVSWTYAQAGLAAPRNAWSPALFPMARRYTKKEIQQKAFRQADLFAIHSASLGRINHVGIVREVAGTWIWTVEGNSADRVSSRRRALATIHAFANWLD